MFIFRNSVYQEIVEVETKHVIRVAQVNKPNISLYCRGKWFYFTDSTLCGVS